MEAGCRVIQAILFDLDGVLVDADRWHFESLNLAFADHDFPEISWSEHLAIYKGLPTRRKLEVYGQRHNLEIPKTVELQKKFWTTQFLVHCEPVPEKVDMFDRLAADFRIVVCSNAIRSSVETMLSKADLLRNVEFYLSNEDALPKPSPEMYLKAMRQLGLKPSECLIVEDSPVGRKAAQGSRAHLCFVDGPEDVNVYRILASVREAERVNVVIPAAGLGKRFAEAGCIYPKPFIEVSGEAMLGRVLENLAPFGDPIVLLQRDHLKRYAARELWPGVRWISVSEPTDGAACTVLLASDLIDNSNELVLANSDQLLDPLPARFLERMRALGADGGIITFPADDPKWSYVRTGVYGEVLEVREKEVISNQATAGVYYFRRGSDFVSYAKRMIAKEIRTNGEFYVCPVYNELIEAGLSVYVHEIEANQMVGLGTPEDLLAFVG